MKSSEWDFPGCCQTVLIILWGWGFLGSSRPILLSPVADRSLVFTATMFLMLLVFKAAAKLGQGRWKKGKFKCYRAHCSTRESATFLANPLLTSRVLKCWFWPVFFFWSIALVFMEYLSGTCFFFLGHFNIRTAFERRISEQKAIWWVQNQKNGNGCTEMIQLDD